MHMNVKWGSLMSIEKVEKRTTKTLWKLFYAYLKHIVYDKAFSVLLVFNSLFKQVIEDFNQYTLRKAFKNLKPLYCSLNEENNQLEHPFDWITLRFLWSLCLFQNQIVIRTSGIIAFNFVTIYTMTMYMISGSWQIYRIEAKMRPIFARQQRWSYLYNWKWRRAFTDHRFTIM